MAHVIRASGGRQPPGANLLRSDVGSYQGADAPRSPKIPLMLYLDHAATTPLLPEAWEAMRPVTAEAFGNPASPPTPPAGRPAGASRTPASRSPAVSARSPDEVVFTSGATEANNLAVFGLAGARRATSSPVPIEHPCVAEPLRQLAARGFEVEWLPVDGRRGRSVMRSARSASRTRGLAAVMLVNHETGAVQPGPRPGRDSVSRLHCDAAQAVGKMPVYFRDLGVTAPDRVRPQVRRAEGRRGCCSSEARHAAAAAVRRAPAAGPAAGDRAGRPGRRAGRRPGTSPSHTWPNRRRARRACSAAIAGPAASERRPAGRGERPAPATDSLPTT